MGGYLAPLREAGLVLAAATAPFLFLPTHYFRTWLFWIFTPLLLLDLYFISTIDPNSSNMFNNTREEYVAGLLVPSFVITLIFIAFHFVRTKRKRKRDERTA